ncbi:acyl-CoA thioesterase [Geotalea daltonii FRC-32]|uniref:Acyl-CoA thioesterase n=1 Tax=Geotalea daltonii (strain DSM 22248 / JCM 15807 / FRC-32) TaxID=316067 RepID=B9M677_GEODF|nr:PaaI family thioesterase [Geotalea daltonii]ACM21865.1 acyl-CoA thioesterase [Geotalea daltonii FRC-32]
MYEKVYDTPMPAGGELPFELPEWIACAPFEEYLGMKIDEAAEGRAILTMPFTVKLSQGVGFMHGGAITALADTAVAMAIKSMLPEGSNFVTMDLGLKFHAPVRSGLVKAEARIVERDERNIKGEAEVFDEAGVKVATFTSVFRVRRQ